MSRRELRRVEAMSRVQAGELQLVDTAEMMEVSYRQGKRWWRRYREQGPEGWKHGNADRPSNRAKPADLREKVLGLVEKKYGGGAGERFGPMLAAEHLEQDDRLQVDPETLRRWMLGAGLWSRGEETEATPEEARQEAAFWRAGAVGRKLPRVAGGARGEAVSDEHGR